MKAYCVCFFLICTAWAQTESKQVESRRFDLNGNPIPGGSFSETKSDASGRTTQIEYGVDANGRRIPLQSVEETKTEQNGVTITQRTLKRFDQNGAVTSTERAVSERRSTGPKASETRSTLYRADVNGNESLAERSTSKSDDRGSLTEVERPGLDGSLRLAERQVSRTESSQNGNTSKTDASTYRLDANGNFYEVVRSVQETQKQGDRTVENRSLFVNRGDGTFGLQEQTVTQSTKRADGSVSKQVEVYGDQVPGTTNESGRPVLKERQTIETVKAANGQQVERIISQKTSPNDGGRLGDPQVIQETVTTASKQ